MPDRTSLRKEFSDEFYKNEQRKQFAKQIASFEALQDTMIEGFNKLFKFLDGKITKTEVINQLTKISTPDVINVVKALEKLDKTTLGTKIELKPILEALKGLQTELAVIRDKEPVKFEQKDSVKVENLNEIKFDTSELEKAIKALDRKVDVKAPIIKTEKTDLKPLQDIMLDLLKAFNKQKQALQEGGTVKVSNLKDIPLVDLEKVEKKLDLSNKHLKEIAEKKMGGGGGGGGNGTPYTDSNGVPKNVILESDGSIPITVSEFVASSVNILTVGVIKTITETDGVLTRTTTIDSTDPNDKDITIVWS